MWEVVVIVAAILFGIVLLVSLVGATIMGITKKK